MAVDDASEQIVIPPPFFDDTSNVTEAVNSLTALQADRLFAATENALQMAAVADVVPAALQTVRDEFLFIINDFCGVPPLSNATLSQLDEYFAVVENDATSSA